MNKKQKLQGELAILVEGHKDKEKAIKKNPEYISVKRKMSRLSKEGDKLYEREENIEENLKLIYLDEGKYPKYKTSYNDNRNIREEVLSSIKRAFGITNLSHLKARDIEDITQKLIDKELKDSEDLKEIREKRNKNSKDYDTAREKKEKFEDKPSDLRNKKWVIQRKISEIDERKKKREDMKNPELAKKHSKWKKEEEAQKKIKNINLEKLRLEITKDKILNNLKDEED